MKPFGILILFGVVSLFADMTYEGARSIGGPFLFQLGAGAVVVAVVAGFGEFVANALKLVSGFAVEKSEKYWLTIFGGYIINLFAVPALALANSWQLAALLMVAERAGKAIRTPPRDAVLSYASQDIGHGFGFGLHEAMDQTGALIGPLLVAGVLWTKHDMKAAFAMLAVPALCALLCLLITRFNCPSPGRLAGRVSLPAPDGKVFVLYLGATGMVAFGFADFALIAFHAKSQALCSDHWIPVVYSLAMGVSALAALVWGKLLDKMGLAVFPFVSILSSMFAPLIFLGTFPAFLAGLCIWGIGLGAQDSIFKAGIAKLVAKEKRVSAYGIYGLSFGLFWFAGSLALGFAYQWSLPALAFISCLSQLCAIPIFIYANRLGK